MRDSCQCACSAFGCLSFTQMSKQPSHNSNGYLPSEALQAALIDTYCTAFILDIDNRPELAWIRSEMFRFHTFQKLKLRHTCCTTERDLIPIESVIAELADEENRHEMRLEQAEQISRLEVLIDEFDREYQTKGIPFIDFFEGYWKQRMNEVINEKSHVDQEKLKEIGVVLHEEDYEFERTENKKINVDGQAVHVTTHKKGELITCLRVAMPIPAQNFKPADCADGQPTAQNADEQTQPWVREMSASLTYMARTVAAQKAASDEAQNSSTNQQSDVQEP